MTDERSICFVLPHFHLEYSGGSETQCFFLATELATRGWRVHYIREAEQAEDWHTHGLVVHAIPRRKAYLKWRNRAALARQMARIKARYWVCRGGLAYLPMVRSIARSTGGEVLFWFSRDTQFSLVQYLELYASLPMKCYAAYEYGRFRLALPRVRLRVVQTGQQERLLTERFGLAGHRIYNSQPVPALAARGYPDAPLILWVGRIKAFKRPELFIELARRLEGSPFRFALVGALDGDALSQRLRSEARVLRRSAATTECPRRRSWCERPRDGEAPETRRRAGTSRVDRHDRCRPRVLGAGNGNPRSPARSRRSPRPLDLVPRRGPRGDHRIEPRLGDDAVSNRASSPHGNARASR